MKVHTGIQITEIDEVVLFPFDRDGLPFHRDLHLDLVQARKFPAEIDSGRNIVLDDRHPVEPVLAQGPPGSPDSNEVICPNVFHINGEYRMWYLGQGDEGKRHSCYAVSRDGIQWEKPNLGLVEYHGSKNNNRVTDACGEWVLYDPEDPDPARRFKCLQMRNGPMHIGTSYSADGLTWTAGRDNVFGIGMEVGHVFKYQGCYYVNGQGGPAPINRAHPYPIRQTAKRTVITYASYDFEHWTRAAAASFRKDPVPPQPIDNFDPHGGHQVHEGAAMWDRGNVLIGLYGHYYCPTNHRGDATVDLGFVVSHDALHLHEPIPDFKMVDSYEEYDHGAPRLIQRNAWAQIGDRTVYWYSLWRREHRRPEDDPTGVRLASWARDRFGSLNACAPNAGEGAEFEPHCISCPIELDDAQGRIFVNAGGLGPYAELKVELLDLQFRPLAGYSGSDAATIRESGLRRPVTFGAGGTLPELDGSIRIRVNWAGVRPEDARLYALYVA